MSRDRSDRRDGATALAATAFLVGLLGAAGFATTYALGEDTVGPTFNQWLGGTLMLALLGLGVGLVAWAQGLMPEGPEAEERAFPGPSPEKRREALRVFDEQNRAIGRRTLLGRLFALAATATGLAALFPIRSLMADPFPQRTRTAWAPGVRLVNEDGDPIRPDDLDVNSVVTAFPEGGVDDPDAQIVLVRVPPRILRPVPGREEWSPEGLLAYSKICTHAGCPVGLYQVETQRLFCPCHQSAFTVIDGAVPIFGPATRPLPQLPLAVDDGFVVAAGDFSNPVGPGFWTYPSTTREEQE